MLKFKLVPRKSVFKNIKLYYYFVDRQCISMRVNVVEVIKLFKG